MGVPSAGGAQSSPGPERGTLGSFNLFFQFFDVFYCLEMATHPRREPHAPARPARTRATASYPKIKPKKTPKKEKKKKKKPIKKTN